MKAIVYTKKGSPELLYFITYTLEIFKIFFILMSKILDMM
jgi:hypothetical protein